MIKRKHISKASNNLHRLKTEFPLSEKDEQANCMEHLRKLQNEALKLWRSLKHKRI
jgi:hypothetical protein